MQATLRIGIADGQLAIQVDGKEIVMGLDQSLELFNAIGEVLEDLGAFKDCDECPNKDACDEYCDENEETPCTLH